MCRKRSYLLTSSYIWGYVRPKYSAGGESVTTGDLYGDAVDAISGLYELSKGCAGPQVKTLQRILSAAGIKDGNGADIVIDGDFGKNTKAATIKLQAKLDLSQDGIVGAKTWKAMLTALE
jgi:peptidoglycan hydrolase-like protein with peptidoglycan-binding domain